MMVRLYYLLFVAILLIMVGCGAPDGQQQVEERERAVLLRERKMDSIESDYQTLRGMRDSIEAVKAALVSDTLSAQHEWPETLTGDWNSKMICRTSGCSGYVIGDQRNELWRFQTDSAGTSVQVIINDREVRRFKGEYDGRQIILSLMQDNTTGVKYNRRAVLGTITPRLVTGNQYLVGQDKCETVFSVELTPRQK